VIVFGSDQEVVSLMKAVRRNNATGNFSWIGSDGWSARDMVSDTNEAEVEGCLSVQPQANPVIGFEEYFLGLTVENNKRNPWFTEFWEEHFQCRYPRSMRTPYNSNYSNECDPKFHLREKIPKFENQLQFVSDSVLAFAHALYDMHYDHCGPNFVGLCEAMKPVKGPELLMYLRKVNFTGLTGDNFHFDNNGDGPARYNIIHFKQVEPGTFKWIKVGVYSDGKLNLNMDDFKNRIRSPTDDTRCEVCPEGTLPDSSRQRCLDIPEAFLRAGSSWAIGAMALSVTGVTITVLVISVFIKHNHTPIVKAAGREVSYVLLSGILLCYLITFVLVLKPTDIVCAIQRFGVGFCFTVVYAALLTKTNRISRIFNAGRRTVKRPNFISPKSQLVICTGLISIQVLINGVWMLVSPPKVMHYYPSRESNILVCSSFINTSYVIAFGYPIVLIVVCTVYAVLTRNIPEAFNESKHIGFTMYTTCVIWLAFVPLYFGIGNHTPLRITTMSVTISLSASVTIVCLFSPKLYIILCHPERNVRQSMMPNMKLTGTKTFTTSNTNAFCNNSTRRRSSLAYKERCHYSYNAAYMDPCMEHKILCALITPNILVAYAGDKEPFGPLHQCNNFHVNIETDNAATKWKTTWRKSFFFCEPCNRGDPITLNPIAGATGNEL
ncbi:hypothetical protein ACI65C_010321, partial [Semiaphis heraclei]